MHRHLVAAAMATLTIVGMAVAAPTQADPNYILDLGGVTFDPLFETPDFPESLAHVSADGPDLQLVQFTDSIRDEDLAALHRHGLSIVQYIHPGTYVVWGEQRMLERARAIPSVRWTGPFAPACRLLPHIRTRAEDPIAIRMLVVRACNVGALVRSMHDLGVGAIERRIIDSTFEVFGCTVPGNRMESLASLPGVYTVQPVPQDGGERAEMADQVNAGNVDGSSIEPGYYQWLTDIGITGQGVTVAVVDSGIFSNNPDLVNRMTGCEGESCNDGFCSAHGTLVAGALAGDGASNITDPWGFLAGIGVAPRMMLFDQLYSPTYQNPDGMLELMRDSRKNGALLSSNSWGPSPVPLGYDLDTRLVDLGVRDADSELYGNQPLGYVLSIMNGSGGTQTQGTPDEALNIVSVGATQFRTAGGSLPNNYGDIASVSAHGPCLDGRLLPDIVAPGCYVLSTYDPLNWGYACGTSMAAPQVAGAIGLFAQHYKNSVSIGRDPSPAMSKAAVLIAAKDLHGNDDADGWVLGHVPDSKQGWGRLQLPELINADPGSMRYVDQTVVFGESGDAFQFNVTPSDPSKPMRVMLVWTTAAGHGLGGTTPAWTNDLDLVVEANGGEYVGNSFHANSGWSVQGGTRDSMNNTEAVFLGPTTPTAATIRIEAANIVADGIPGYGDATDQDFALVCWNCEADPFTLDLDPPWQEGCAPSTILTTVEVNETGGGSSPVVLNVSGDVGLTFELEDSVLVPPATTNLMITLPLGAEGVFNFAVIGNSSSFEQSALGQIVVVDDVPEAPALLEPGDGGGEISTLPILRWSDVDGASAYAVEISQTADFASVFYSAAESGTSHAVVRHLAFGATYYWRVRSLNACGEGSWSSVSMFTTSEGVVVLFVDDDDDAPDIGALYTEVLDDLGVTYDIWNTGNSDFEPDLITLGAYDLVIWASGGEWGGSAGPGELGEMALASWLDSGGTLLLSSQDYLYDHGLTAFGENYLGIASYESDVGQSDVVGVSAPFDLIPSMTLSYPFSDYSDTLELADSASIAFDGEHGTAGAMIDQGTWRTVFLAFPAEAIPDLDHRRQLLSVMINWVPQPPDCPADITGDGEVNIKDLLQVLSQWGGTGSADVNDSGVVDVMDLLAIVAGWGICD